MNPKEKASELVDKYINFISEIVASSEYIQYKSKRCALIAVDEILNAINPFGQFLGGDYWQEVKEEIKKY